MNQFFSRRVASEVEEASGATKQLTQKKISLRIMNRVSG